MKKEEIVNYLLNEKKYLSTRLSWIDNFMDREGFSRRYAKEKEELNKEYEECEKRIEEINKLLEMIDTIKIIDRKIGELENKIDNLEILIGKQKEIKEIEEKILKYEEKKEEIISYVKNKIKPQINSNVKKR